MTGSGANWQAGNELFKISGEKLGLKYLTEEAGHFDDFIKGTSTFRRVKEQGDLFD